jgi:hypothetical protein
VHVASPAGYLTLFSSSGERKKGPTQVFARCRWKFLRACWSVADVSKKLSTRGFPGVAAQAEKLGTETFGAHRRRGRSADRCPPAVLAPFATASPSGICIRKVCLVLSYVGVAIENAPSTFLNAVTRPGRRQLDKSTCDHRCCNAGQPCKGTWDYLISQRKVSRVVVDHSLSQLLRVLMALEQFGIAAEGIRKLRTPPPIVPQNFGVLLLHDIESSTVAVRTCKEPPGSLFATTTCTRPKRQADEFPMLEDLSRSRTRDRKPLLAVYTIATHSGEAAADICRVDWTRQFGDEPTKRHAIATLLAIGSACRASRRLVVVAVRLRLEQGVWL